MQNARKTASTKVLALFNFKTFFLEVLALLVKQLAKWEFIFDTSQNY